MVSIGTLSYAPMAEIAPYAGAPGAPQAHAPAAAKELEARLGTDRGGGSPLGALGGMERLLFSIPEDLHRFRALTEGNAISIRPPHPVHLPGWAASAQKAQLCAHPHAGDPSVRCRGRALCGCPSQRVSGGEPPFCRGRGNDLPTAPAFLQGGVDHSGGRRRRGGRNSAPIWTPNKRGRWPIAAHGRNMAICAIVFAVISEKSCDGCHSSF